MAAARNPARLKKRAKPRPQLEPIEHPALTRKRVTFKRLPKYVESLLAAVAPVMLPETLDSLRKNIAIGDTRAAEILLKSFKILPVSGISVTQNNSNTAAAEAVGGHKTFDAYIRDRAVEKRMVVDIAAAVEEAEECSSNPQLPAGSATSE